MKATRLKLVVLLIGIVIVAGGLFYLAKFLAELSGRTPLKDLLSAGIELFEKKQYNDARAKLEECYQKAPEGNLKNQALLFISRCHGAEGDRQKAMESWGKVIENQQMQSDHPEAYYRLAALQSAGGTAKDLQQAEQYYRKAAAEGKGSRFGDLAEIEIANLNLDRGNLPGAQQILTKLQKDNKSYPQLKKAIFKLHMKLLFSPTITEVPQSDYHIVQQGDTLDEIAKRFGTTSDLLRESNRVDPRRLQIGKRLKVVTGKFLLRISKSKNILQLLSGDVLLNEYQIGTGKYGSTPTGKFKIADKVKEPPWFRDGRVIPYGDPANVLGTRWMKLESIEGQKELTGYGIHGTDDESTIGKESSEGCIRLLNRDVEELYKILPIGTEVIIEN